MKLGNLFVLVWVVKSFFTIDDMAKFINTLPPGVASDSKVVVINSQRSFLGTWSNPYFLIYRAEK